MQISNVEKYKIERTPFYAHISSRGQITLPKQLRNIYELNTGNQLIKISGVKTGLLLEPVVAITKKNHNDRRSRVYAKDPKLIKAERADIDSFLRGLAGR